MVKPGLLRRRALLSAAGGLALGVTGCASTGDAPPEEAAATSSLLRPWIAITGGWRLDPQSPFPVARPIGPRVSFVQPTGVAARGDFLLVADAGARMLWRVDRPRDAVAPLAPFTGGVPDHGASLQLGEDFSAWVALPAEHMVVQYDLRGRLVRRWRADVDAPRPVAVVVPADRSEVLVGDAATATILVFDPLGHPRGVLGGRRPPALRSVSAMALGPAGLYVLDPLARQVLVLDPRGVPVGAIGQGQLLRPRALAVDAAGRVFVGDDADQRIKVFRGPELLASVGGPGAGPARFGRIESLALDGPLLYVADSLNARVQVLQLGPAAEGVR
jgi:DNA-binding beta-propeller fold protein YncE